MSHAAANIPDVQGVNDVSWLQSLSLQCHVSIILSNFDATDRTRGRRLVFIRFDLESHLCNEELHKQSLFRS